jgi:LuxR family transcriptional regulator, maltose regulon positive regulatory protein
MRDDLDQGYQRDPARGVRRLPLLTTKLAAPPQPAGVVIRPRLLRQLDIGVDRSITLISAPAGWGKTTLLSCWVRGNPQLPVVWLSLEPGDGEDRFWSYLHAALDAVDPDLPEPPGTVDEEYVVRLADALTRRRQPVVVALDDLHRVEDRPVLDGLDFLLRHAGDRLRLVAAARTGPLLPLHHWRLRGELTEIGAEELSFTPAETAELLAAHGVVLPAGRVRDLHARTEGWAAGLRFAALSLDGHPDPARFVAGFTGDHPDVAAYLTAEFLSGLSAEVRDALVSAAVSRELRGGLVNAITGRADGERLLDEAARLGFVVPIDVRPPAYRCHRMLADLLDAERLRRRPEDIRDLHRRAAAWYAAQHRPAEALRHTLVAGEWHQATEVLTERWPVLAAHRGAHVDAPVPPPPEAVRATPELALACAAERLCFDDPERADGYLDLARQHEGTLTGAHRQRFAMMFAAVRLSRALSGGDSSDIIACARRLLALAPARPDGSDLGASALARMALGTAALMAGDMAEADRELTEAADQAERVGLARVVQACVSRLALTRALRGELRAAERYADRALAGDGGSERTHAYLALAAVNAQRDLPEAAEANLALAGDLSTREPGAAALAELIRAQVLHDRRDLTGSYQALLTGREIAGRSASPLLTHGFAAVEAGLCLTRGDAGRAIRLLQPLVEEQSATPLAATLARAYLHAGDVHAAARTVPDWDGQDGEAWPLPVRLEAGLADALAAWLQDDHRRASRTLERVLELAEPDGHRRVFTRADPPVRDLLVAHLDSGTAYWSVVNDLLAACQVPDSRPVAAPGEPLTDRELTVLRYLQSILSNVEIASELSLSVNTVKTHVRNIYRKLDATRRRDAVRRARELRLI